MSRGGILTEHEAPGNEPPAQGARAGDVGFLSAGVSHPVSQQPFHAANKRHDAQAVTRKSPGERSVTMNRRQHAGLARRLISACGGLDESAAACRIGKTQLSECQNPHGEAFMPADVIFDLEEHCGKPIYSRALFEARPDVIEARDLIEEACEAAETVTDLQKKIRLAAKDGVITPRERDELARDYASAEDELRHVGQLIKAR